MMYILTHPPPSPHLTLPISAQQLESMAANYQENNIVFDVVTFGDGDSEVWEKIDYCRLSTCFSDGPSIEDTVSLSSPSHLPLIPIYSPLFSFIPLYSPLFSFIPLYSLKFPFIP
jgi:hypothetical protein